MKKTNLLAFMLTVLCTAGLLSCSGIAGSSENGGGEPAGYLMYRSDVCKTGTVAELEEKCTPSLFYVFPEKGCALQIQDLKKSEIGTFCFVNIYSWNEQNGVVTAELLKMGKTRKHGDDVEVTEPPFGRTLTYTFERAESPESEVALRGYTEMLRDSLFLAPCDSVGLIVEDLFADPHFAAVKDFVKDCRPASETEAEADAQESDALKANKDGIEGVMKLGDDISSLPKTVDGLYDKMTVKKEYNEVEDYEYTTIIFSLAGQTTIQVLSSDNVKVEEIEISSPAVTIHAGGKAWRVGDKAAGLEYNEEAVAYDCGGCNANVDTDERIISFTIGRVW